MKYIGNKFDRVDGYEKVTGRTKYADDYVFPDMLHVGVVRSIKPHAKILKLDTEAAMIDGVIGIYTGKDFPGENIYGFPVCDDQILSNGEVKYIGDAIAIVVAKTREIANKAASLVKVCYEELKTCFNARESEDMLGKLVIKKNVNNIIIAEEDVVLEMSLSTKHQEHMYIETEGAVALFEEDGKLTVYSPMQSPFVAKGIMQHVFGLPENKVRIIQSTVGGSFGGKDDCMYEACGFAALGAYMTKKPCKYSASREESIVSSYKRHPMYADLKLVASKDGKFKGMKVRNIMDGGAYSAAGPFVQYRNTTHSAGPYVYDWVDVENKNMYTNNVYSAAFRAFGGIQACFFYDTIVDEMSYKLHIDPMDLRLKNVWKIGTTTSTDQKVDWEPAIEEVLQKIRKKSDWDNKRKEFKEFNNKNKYYKKGIGVSLGYHGISLGAEGQDFSQTEVIYQKESNKILVTCGITDLGQGSRTVFTQIACEALDLSRKFIEVNNYDTDVTKDSGPTVASRGTTMGGRSIIAACNNFIYMIREEAAKVYRTDIKNISYKGEKLYLNSIEIDSLMGFCKKLSEKQEVKTYGRFDMPDISWEEHTGLGIPYIAYHYGANVCYLTVDMVTGMVSIDEYFAVHDIGKVINPVCLRGQIIGGIAQGIGYALMEDIGIYNGVIENRNFDNYLIPTSMDIPPIHTETVESNEPIGPYGAKGTGEPVLTPVPACIGNAIRFATGKRIEDLPFSLEKIVLGKELSKYGR